MPSFLWDPRGQRIACAGDQLEKRVCRDLLKDSIQTFNPSFNKIRQGAGRVEHAEQNMGIRSTHVQIRKPPACLAEPIRWTDWRRGFLTPPLPEPIETIIAIRNGLSPLYVSPVLLSVCRNQNLSPYASLRVARSLKLQEIKLVRTFFFRFLKLLPIPEASFDKERRSHVQN